MIETYYMRSQMFYKTAVLKNFCKIHKKTPMLESLFDKVAHVLFYDLCGIFKNTLKIKQRFCINKLAK